MAAITVLDYLLALVPVLLMTGLFVWLDVFKLMSRMEMLGLLVAGAVVALAAYPISGRVIDAFPMGFSNYSRFVAPWIEEALKGIAVAGLITFNRIGYKVDAVICGFAIGAGFSVVENIFYLQRFAELPPSVWMVRGLGTAMMHGTTCAVMAAIAHEFAERATRRAEAFTFNPLWMVPGFLVAGALHMGFNQFPDQPLVAMLAAGVGTPVVLMSIFHFGAKEAQQWLLTERAAHRDSLLALEAGRWPDDASGRRLAKFAASQSADDAAATMDFVTAAMRLTVIAEEKLLGEPVPPPGEIRALVERRNAARARLGRAKFCVIGPLLPFSRNDEWEVHELEEDLKRGSV